MGAVLMKKFRNNRNTGFISSVNYKIIFNISKYINYNDTFRSFAFVNKNINKSLHKSIYTLKRQVLVQKSIINQILYHYRRRSLETFSSKNIRDFDIKDLFDLKYLISDMSNVLSCDYLIIIINAYEKLYYLFKNNIILRRYYQIKIDTIDIKDLNLD